MLNIIETWNIAKGIYKKFFTNNPCYNFRATRTPIGIQLHTIGCAQDSADVLWGVMNNPSYMAGVHYLVSASDRKIINCIPENIRGWSDGGYGNDHLISFEICESRAIKYIPNTAQFNVLDKVQFLADLKRGYENAVALCADICKRYGWNPMDKLPSGLYRISSHDEGRRAGLSTAHVDPVHVWNYAGYTMDKFRQDVADVLINKESGTVSDTPVSAVVPDDKPYYYRVQTGAFSVKENADAQLSALKGKGYTDAFEKRIGQYWKIQLGAFTMPENAEKLMEKVKADGFPAFVTKEELKEKYQVWVGACNVDSLNVRTGPGINYSLLAEYPELKNGNKMDVIGKTGDWYKVRIIGQYVGYVYSDYVDKV